MPFIVSRAFDVPSSRPDDNFGQPIDLAGTIRPEGDPALVGDMLRRLGDTKKLRGTVRSDSFELQPAFDPDIACESQCRQYRLVEWSRFSQTVYSQVNVIVSTPHQYASQAVSIAYRKDERYSLSGKAVSQEEM
jgi:hypothetical protein